jgi:hypothetical protein
MSPPDLAVPSTIAANVARPSVEVRHNGDLIKRVTSEEAEMLVLRAWGGWTGSGRRRYINLTAAAPFSTIRSRNVGMGKPNTKPVMADGSCRTYARGQAIGDPRISREFHKSGA